jgi:hypothetical protein
MLVENIWDDVRWLGGVGPSLRSGCFAKTLTEQKALLESGAEKE